MNIFDQISEIEYLDEHEVPYRIKTRKTSGKDQQGRKTVAANHLMNPNILDQKDRTEQAAFTYQPSQFERSWLLKSLGEFYEEHWFDDLLRLIKGGKEASVYLCAGNQTSGVDLIAAKVYRPRMYRNLKDDYLYRDGRTRLDSAGVAITDDGMNHAMNKRTQYGLDLLQMDWIQHEYTTMTRLYEAGANLPKPLACAHNAVLMEYIGDEELPAQPLNSITLSSAEAKRLWKTSLQNIEIMLNLGLIHGDLSAYNLLYWDKAIFLIDFPQALPIRSNRNAWIFFKRDIARLAGYFIRCGLELDPHQIACDLWHKYKPDAVDEMELLAMQEPAG